MLFRHLGVLSYGRPLDICFDGHLGCVQEMTQETVSSVVGKVTSVLTGKQGKPGSGTKQSPSAQQPETTSKTTKEKQEEEKGGK